MSGRARRPADALALAAVYAAMPAVQCRGLCQEGCASIGMTPLEQRTIWVRHGINLPLVGAFALEDPDGRCPALTVEGRCSVYASRPWICRAYGATDRLRCPHGCEPEGGLWPNSDALRSLARVEEISGNPHRAAVLRSAAAEP